jgi:hypothetical protein
MQALPGSKLPILARYMYNGHCNPRSSFSLTPSRLPEWKGNRRNQRRTPVTF